MIAVKIYNLLIKLHLIAQMGAPFVFGVAAFAAATTEKTQRFWFTICWISMVIFATVFLGQAMLASDFGQETFPKTDLIISAVCLMIGVGVWFMWLRLGQPRINAFTQKIVKRSAVERNKKSDIRQIEEFLPDSFEFDPEDYFDDAKGVFLGLDEFKKGVYVVWEKFLELHALLSGRTRIGKGVAAQTILPQSIIHGNLVAVLDPKGDAYLPDCLYQFCKKYNKKYSFNDLNQHSGHLLNPLDGATEAEKENILIATLGLEAKGDLADHYRLADRAAARQLAKWMTENPGSTLAAGFNALGSEWKDSCPGFHASLRELAELASINAKGGVSLEEYVKTGGCLYFVGDMENSRILRAQRMILLRLTSIARNREKTPETRTITVFADEFKCHISKPFTTSLAAAAGWKLQLILAFQSFSDLNDMPKDLDKEAVKGSVIENSGISISYAIKDPETADFISDMTGKILVDDEVRRVTKNAGMAETLEPERQIRQSERNLYDRNMIMSLKKGTAILNVAGELAKAIHIAKIKVEKNPEAVKSHPVGGDKVVVAAELI